MGFNASLKTRGVVVKPVGTTLKFLALANPVTADDGTYTLDADERAYTVLEALTTDLVGITIQDGLRLGQYDPETDTKTAEHRVVKRQPPMAGPTVRILCETINL